MITKDVAKIIIDKSYELIILKDKSPTKNNVYMIIDKITRQAAIVDPACEMKLINKIISEYSLDLKLILLTHSHLDHVRRVDEIVNMYNTKVFLSKQEAGYYYYCCKNLQIFQDGDTITLGGTRFHCYVTPGHTAGSICYLCNNSLFTGDTIFIEGCGICSTYGGSAARMYESVNRLKREIRDSVLIYPGHTYGDLPGKSMEYVKNNNIYLMFDKEDDFIRFRMRENQNNLFRFI